ncbi:MULTISPECIES: hypothetical protein [Streptomyces]|uniref:hypothetical protein n=1 Tax=Streptomyces TaxID=1883 RepID=UPI001F220A92|nr:hypothetical protein [Streptomyces spororaveus]
MPPLADTRDCRVLDTAPPLVRSAPAGTGADREKRHEAKRAESAAQTTRDIHANRVGLPLGDTVSGDEPVVERLLTRRQAEHARTVLDYV